jgi:hypothetical protein
MAAPLGKDDKDDKDYLDSVLLTRVETTVDLPAREIGNLQAFEQVLDLAAKVKALEERADQMFHPATNIFRIVQVIDIRLAAGAGYGTSRLERNEMVHGGYIPRGLFAIGEGEKKSS